MIKILSLPKDEEKLHVSEKCEVFSIRGIFNHKGILNLESQIVLFFTRYEGLLRDNFAPDIRADLLTMCHFLWLINFEKFTGHLLLCGLKCKVGQIHLE